VGTTFISQNVLRTPLLLSPFKANCLRFSTTVCDTQLTLILFFLSFFWINVQSKRNTIADPEDHLWSADHSLGNADLDISWDLSISKIRQVYHKCQALLSLIRFIVLNVFAVPLCAQFLSTFYHPPQHKPYISLCGLISILYSLMLLVTPYIYI
jgi:hypothetical protein